MTKLGAEHTVQEDKREAGHPNPLFMAGFLLLFANFWVGYYFKASRERWGTLLPDPTHTYPMLFRGGVTYYFPRALGLYMDIGFWFQIAVIALAVLVSYVTRKRPAA